MKKISLNYDYIDQLFADYVVGNMLCSVLIVDYDMPQKTGLEICSELKGTSFKKLLLTGVADSKLAVNAFNSNKIDGFIRKDNPNMMNELKESIYSLESNFWRLISSVFEPYIQDNIYKFIVSDDFKSFFGELCHKLDVKAYNVIPEPLYIQLITKNNQKFALHLRCQNDQLQEVEFALDVQCASKYSMALSHLENIPIQGVRHYLENGKGLMRGHCLNGSLSYFMQPLE